MREVSTDLNILITPTEWERVSRSLPEELGKAGYGVRDIHAEVVDLTCEPDNMLISQFAQEKGRMPIVESLHRVVINGHSDLGLRELTRVTVGALPEGTYWYGSSYEGTTEPGVNAACAWQHRD
ncbi:hypothetical protein [Corynebacterium pacaense]|uniref:hypothetical protein n=1 Tax=Corynebacterium pacaense TaxID=1816684 RepID=UPI0009BC1DBD|nr:hypothetical protein [Corynebacterium pacaense]